MRKITILVVALFAVLASVSAQKDEKSIGLSLGYGTNIETLGIGARFQYNFTDHLRIAPEFMYFFPNSQSVLGVKSESKQWDINVNAHYLFPIQEKLNVYPIAGLIFSHGTGSVSGSFVNSGDLNYSASTTKVGINLGGGAQYDFSKAVFGFVEIKYGIVSDIDQAVISAGVACRF